MSDPPLQGHVHEAALKLLILFANKLSGITANKKIVEIPRKAHMTPSFDNVLSLFIVTEPFCTFSCLAFLRENKKFGIVIFAGIFPQFQFFMSTFSRRLVAK